MPKVSFECEFCGEKFQSKTKCQEHEKKCLKNENNFPIKKISFMINVSEKKIDQNITNIDFINGKNPETRIIHFENMSGYGYFRSEVEKNWMIAEFNKYAANKMKSLISEKEKEIEDMKSFISKLSDDEEVSDDKVVQLLKILNEVCKKKGLNVIDLPNLNHTNDHLFDELRNRFYPGGFWRVTC